MIFRDLVNYKEVMTRCVGCVRCVHEINDRFQPILRGFYRDFPEISLITKKKKLRGRWMMKLKSFHWLLCRGVA